MTNIAVALKSEISRIARKETRSQLDALKKSSSVQKKQIANLRQVVADLERQVRKLGKGLADRPSPVSDDEDQVSLRFRAAGFAAHRQRLGLSAADCGKLVGVSALTIYKWEKGESRPRKAHLPAIALLRRMGKREALAKLEERG